MFEIKITKSHTANDSKPLQLIQRALLSFRFLDALPESLTVRVGLAF